MSCSLRSRKTARRRGDARHERGPAAHEGLEADLEHARTRGGERSRPASKRLPRSAVSRATATGRGAPPVDVSAHGHCSPPISSPTRATPVPAQPLREPATRRAAAPRVAEDRGAHLHRAGAGEQELERRRRPVSMPPMPITGMPTARAHLARPCAAAIGLIAGPESPPRVRAAAAAAASGVDRHADARC